MRRAEIFVDGDVQGVGYRYWVRRAARKRGLVGSVENLEDGRVRILCEGDEGAIKAFLEDINIQELPIFVENIDYKFSEATGEFKVFKIITGKLEDEMIEGFATGAAYLTVLRGEVREFREESRESFTTLGDKIDKFREESRESFANLGDKIDKFREESRESSVALGGIIDMFRKESGENFKELDEKYHTVSQELRLINKNLEILAKEISLSNKLIVTLMEKYISKK